MRRLLSLLAVIVVVVGCGGGSGTSDNETAGDEGGARTETPAADEENNDSTSTTVPTDDDGGGSDATTESGQGSSGDGECTITVTGDFTETISYPQSVFTFTSDYWATEEALREVVEFLGEDNTEGSYEELVARGEPITGWFIYNCVDPDDPGAGVIVLPTNGTTPDQFPMGPGSYEVTGGLFDATGPEATVISNFGVSAEEQYDPVPGSGDLVITRWDQEALEGTITFDGVESFAEGDPREINVMVEFTVMCQPGFHTACG